MALVAYRAHPLAKARFPKLPPRTPHPRAAILGGALGACALVIAFGLRRTWRRGASSSPPAILEVARVWGRGYRAAPLMERSALNLLGSFGVTIALTRGVTYVQTQRQPLLPVKKLRQMRRGHARVHHYVPGMALAFTSGTVGLMLEEKKLAPWLALPYGVGMGLTLDEAALLLELPHSYWTQEHVAAIQAGVALAGAAALLFRIARQGEGTMPPDGLMDRAGRDPA